MKQLINILITLVPAEGGLVVNQIPWLFYLLHLDDRFLAQTQRVVQLAPQFYRCHESILLSYLSDFLVQIESFLEFSWAAVKILLPSIICFGISHCRLQQHTCGGSCVVSAAVWENMIL